MSDSLGAGEQVREDGGTENRRFDETEQAVFVLAGENHRLVPHRLVVEDLIRRRQNLIKIRLD
jgi:hypothetical protein